MVQPWLLVVPMNIVCLLQLLSSGEVEVSLDMQEVLSKHDGPRELSSLVGKYLYIAVLVQEDTGMLTPPSRPDSGPPCSKNCG